MSYCEENGQVIRAGWTKIGPRSHKRSCGLYDAFVFGASVPVCLWAWSVYWRGGHSSGIEHSFRAAKNKAEESIKGNYILNSPGAK